jgi:hypothetical protein
MSNDNEQIIEDVEEKDLVVESEVEVSEETEVTEQEQPLSNTVLDILLGEAKKKNEAEEDDAEVEEDEELDEAKAKSEDAEEDEESEDAEEDEEEEVEESAKKVEEDDSEEVEEDEVEEAVEEDDSEEAETPELPEVTTKAGYLAASYDQLKGMKKTALVSAYKAVNMSEDEGEVEVPKTKAEIINSMYGQLKAMKKDDLTASYNAIMASCGGMHEETEEGDFAADLAVLAEADQELTEDFKAKASILFEAAVANKVKEIEETLEEKYTEDLQEEATYIRESLVSKIDDYLSYVVESWIEENQEFVDNKLRTEIAENFMSALQSTFTEHYIEVPDSKVDLVDQLAEEAAEVKVELEEAVAQKAELANQVETLQREKILSEASADLASTQAEKLSSLVEETDFVDADSFEAKVATIKEGFFKDSETKEVITETKDSATTEVKTIVEGEVSEEAKLPADMAKYVKSLSRFNK